MRINKAKTPPSTKNTLEVVMPCPTGGTGSSPPPSGNQRCHSPPNGCNLLTSNFPNISSHRLHCLDFLPASPPNKPDDL